MPGIVAAMGASTPQRSGAPHDCRRVLAVGHLAGTHLFGAERSLLDVLDGFRAIGIDVVTAVPATDNTAYLAEIGARCSAVREFPVRAEWPRRPIAEATVEAIVALVREHQVDAVHVNTVVPVEAMIAANRCAVPAVVHAREIPFDDPEFWQWLGVAGPAEVIDPVLAHATHVIAPSIATAAVYPLMGATSLVPNVVDVHAFDEVAGERGRDPASPVRVALVGSTTARKGLLDFVAIARRLEPADAQFVVVGPVSDLLAHLQVTGELPPNVHVAGYAATPPDAMRQADIVLSLSNCQEAFGRTIVEAMAAGLPVVGFAQGGTPELIVDGGTGFLVAPGDLDGAVQRVAQLVADHALREAMGAAGRELVREHFSPAALAEALTVSYRSILPDRSAVQQAAGDRRIALPTANRTPFAEPFYVANRARNAHCTAVRFLDDRHLVTASLLGREVHLVRLDAQGDGTIVQSLTTTDGQHDVSIDLLDVALGERGTGLMVTANCEASSVSLYHVSPRGLRFERSLAVDAQAASYCHGTAFVPGRPGLLCAAVTTIAPRVQFLHLDGGRVPAPFVQEGWVPKNAAFAGELMVVASVARNVDQNPRTRHGAQVALVALDEECGRHRIIDTCELPGSSLDGCFVHDGTALITDQANDRVLVFDITGGMLRRLDDLLGFSFPHDVALSPPGDLLAVANYGPNELRIRRMPRATRMAGSPASPSTSSVRRPAGGRWSPRRLVRGRGWWRSGRPGR